jgi:sugar phosphate isomerase/epimerase
MNDYSLLSINQVTTREQWTLQQAIEGYARHDIHAIAVWRDKLAAVGVKEAARMLRDHGMSVTGYCIGGMLTDADDAVLQRSFDDNLRIIEEAAEIQSRCIVFLPGPLPERSRDLNAARERACDGLGKLLPHAKAAGVTIGLEPLHPMVCALRSCVVSLKQANDWCDRLNAGSELGIAFDTYNLWWEPDLEQEIARAGKRIVAFHVSDWLRDTQDLRLDRGMPGDGVIDIPKIRGWVEAAGYQGHREIEILSARDWWQRDPDEVVQVIKERYAEYV